MSKLWFFRSKIVQLMTYLEQSTDVFIKTSSCTQLSTTWLTAGGNGSPTKCYFPHQEDQINLTTLLLFDQYKEVHQPSVGKLCTSIELSVRMTAILTSFSASNFFSFFNFFFFVHEFRFYSFFFTSSTRPTHFKSKFITDKELWRYRRPNLTIWIKMEDNIHRLKAEKQQQQRQQ